MHLLQRFNVYMLAVYHFAHRGVRQHLLTAMTNYQTRLLCLPGRYRFDFIVACLDLVGLGVSGSHNMLFLLIRVLV